VHSWLQYVKLYISWTVQHALGFTALTRTAEHAHIDSAHELRQLNMHSYIDSKWLRHGVGGILDFARQVF
jgi:hypothetical protein